MFEEAQYFAPVVEHDDGTLKVQLGKGHPGFADPHYRERESIIEVPSDVGPLPQPAVIPRLSATPGRVTHAGPPLGAHTDEVLTGLLAMTPADVAALRSQRVI